MDLNRGERNALKRFSLRNDGFQAVSRWKGIGLPSMHSLAEKGLVVEGPSGIYGPTFQLTCLGAAWLKRLTSGPGAGFRRQTQPQADARKTAREQTAA